MRETPAEGIKPCSTATLAKASHLSLDSAGLMAVREAAGLCRHAGRKVLLPKRLAEVIANLPERA